MAPSDTCTLLNLSNRGVEELLVLEEVAGHTEELDLSCNHLSCLLPAHTQHLVSLKQLNVARNKLADASGLMLLPQLRLLNLARNKLRDLTSLQGLTLLQQLDVHSNKLTSLAPLGTLISLHSINAAGNQLQELPTLTALTCLTELNLRHNNITLLTLPPVHAAAKATQAGPGSSAGSSALLPSSLRRLSLACNALQEVSTLAALRQLTALQDLCLDGNPFTAASRQPRPVTAAFAGGGGVGAGSCTNSSGSTAWYREAELLAAGTPSLLMLDGQAITPAERILVLPTARKATDAANTQHQQEQQQLLQQALTAMLYSRRQPEPLAASQPVTGPEGDAAAAEPGGGDSTEAIAAAPADCAVAATAASPTDPSSTVLCSAGGIIHDGPRAAAAAAPATEPHCGDSVDNQHQHQQQQQHTHQQACQLEYEGSLRQAAVACGIAVPAADASSAAAAAGAKQSPASKRSPTASPQAAAAAAAGPTAVGDVGSSADIMWGCVCLSEAEVEECLQVERARLQARTRGGPPPHSPPPATPGMELSGNRCVLTGPVLHLLRGEAVAAVSDLTLAHVDYDEVLDALPLLLALRRLRHLSLVNTRGLRTLPQLHPLLQLRRLSHLSLQHCPICSLVLLRPYVAFRFSSLQSLNGTSISAEEVAAAGQMFGALEAALDKAMDQAPQQAALAAAGIQLSSSSGGRQCPASAVATDAPGIAAAQGVQATAGTAATYPTNSTPGALRQQHQQGAGAQDAAGCKAVSMNKLGAAGSSSRVSQVLAAMRGPLLPPEAVVAEARQFAQQLLREAVVVQQQLAVFEEETWPALIEAGIHEAWSGHAAGVAPVSPSACP